MESCRECEAILLEYRRAYADFWLNASPETRNLYQSVANLIGGTEDDVVRLEGLAPPFRAVSAEQLSMKHRREGGPYQGTSDSERIREVMVRKIKHQMATGHFVKFAIGEDSGEGGRREGDSR
jgi:ribosomal protein L34E